MPSITAVLHTENDAIRIGRALETLYACDQILIVDHNSRDRTLQVAREYGAAIRIAKPGAPLTSYLHNLATGWILCLDPRESVTEGLAASLFEFKLASAPQSAFSIRLREETRSGWADATTAHTRLVPSAWRHWNGRWPEHDPAAPALAGELLRFRFP